MIQKNIDLQKEKQYGKTSRPGSITCSQRNQSYFLVLWGILKQLEKQINQPMHSEYVMRFSDPDRRTLA